MSYVLTLKGQGGGLTAPEAVARLCLYLRRLLSGDER